MLVAAVAVAIAVGVVDGFGTTGTVAAALIVVVGLAGTAAGVIIPKRAAGAAGAPRSSLLVGGVGAVVGFFAIPVIGLPIGGVVGIYLGERLRTGDGDVAWRTTRATVRGFGLATLAQLAAALVMAAIWVVWVLL